MQRHFLSWLYGSMLAFGCEQGGQSGGEVTAGGIRCDEAVQALEDESTLSVLGFNAAEILVFSAANHSAFSVWQSPDLPIAISSNGDGDTEISVEVQYLGGEIRYVESTYIEPEIRSGDLIPLGIVDQDQACPERLEIEVSAVIHTSDGLLDETIDATLTARHAWAAELVAVFAAEDQEGALALSVPRSSDAEILPLEIRAQLAQGLFAGALRGTVREMTDEVASTGVFELLRWGPPACDPPGATIPSNKGSPAASSMLNVVNESASLALTWMSGQNAELTLSVGMADAFACMGVDETNGHVLDATATATSSDGRIASTLGMELYGTPTASGAFSRVQVNFQAPFGKAVTPEQFESTFGISGIDLSGYDLATVNFQSTYELTAGGTLASGQLQVVGLTTLCPDEPQSCPIESDTVIDSATWQAR